MLYTQQGLLSGVPARFHNEHERVLLLSPLHEKLDNHLHNYKEHGKNSMFSLQARFRLKGAID